MTLDEVDFEVQLLDAHEVAPERLPLPRRTTPSAATRLIGRLRTRALLAQSAPNPRHHSVVRRFVWEDSQQVLARFARLAAAPADHRPPRLDLGHARLRLDPEHHDYRLAARLRVSWSLSSYPVWLSLEPWWGERSVIGLELRSTHRLRYSHRYFDTAHDALRELIECLGAPIGARTLTPPRRPWRPPTPPRPAVAARPRRTGGIGRLSR